MYYCIAELLTICHDGVYKPRSFNLRLPFKTFSVSANESEPLQWRNHPTKLKTCIKFWQNLPNICILCIAKYLSILSLSIYNVTAERFTSELYWKLESLDRVQTRAGHLIAWNNVFATLTLNLTLTFWSQNHIILSSLAILVSAVLVLSWRQTDRQTDRQNHRITDAAQSLTYATIIRLSNKYNWKWHTPTKKI